MSGSYFSFKIEALRPDSNVLIAEAAFLAFVDQRLSDMADQHSMAVYLLDYLQMEGNSKPYPV